MTIFPQASSKKHKSALSGSINSPSSTATFVSGNGATDNSKFRIRGNQLLTNAIFDFETRSSYSVRVRLTTAAGTSIEQSLGIQITNENESPRVSIGGPYTAIVDEVFSLDSFSTDPDANQIPAFEWDLDFTGRLNVDVVGSHPVVSFSTSGTKTIITSPSLRRRPSSSSATSINSSLSVCSMTSTKKWLCPRSS